MEHQVTAHIRRIETVEKDLKALSNIAATKDDLSRVRAEVKKIYDGLEIGKFDVSNLSRCGKQLTEGFTEFLNLRQHVWGIRKSVTHRSVVSTDETAVLSRAGLALPFQEREHNSCCIDAFYSFHCQIHEFAEFLAFRDPFDIRFLDTGTSVLVSPLPTTSVSGCDQGLRSNTWSESECVDEAVFRFLTDVGISTLFFSDHLLLMTVVHLDRTSVWT